MVCSVHCIIMDNISLYDWGKLRLFQVVQGELQRFWTRKKR